jgi:RNA polymerase sigma-70 factor (ECF subfamily)
LFYRILKNRIRDWHRRRAVRNRVLSFFGGHDEDETDPMAAVPGPSEDNPLERLEADESLAALATALEQLPARQREAFMLRTFEGLDVAETALAMECSEGSVKTHHSRAVNRLRELLGEQW